MVAGLLISNHHTFRMRIGLTVRSCLRGFTIGRAEVSIVKLTGVTGLKCKLENRYQILDSLVYICIPY